VKKSPHWTSRLMKLDACNEAVVWAREYPTLEAAWAACERGDWMLWLLARVGYDSEVLTRLVYSFADRAVRVDVPAALRSAAAVPGMPAEHAEKLLAAASGLEALPVINSRAAARAARTAAEAARTAAEAARTAAEAASAAVWAARAAAGAASTAARAASAAAWAARAAAWAARDAARAARLKEQAEEVRHLVPMAPDLSVSGAGVP